MCTSLSSAQSGSLPSSSPAHQPGTECEFSHSLRPRPAGCALGQHVLSCPDCQPSTDVPQGTDGEYARPGCVPGLQGHNQERWEIRERSRENSRSQEQEEGGGRSPRAEWAAVGLGEGQVQDEARESHPQFLPSLPISELSQGDGAGCMPKWCLKLTGEQTDSTCSTETSWLP